MKILKYKGQGHTEVKFYCIYCKTEYIADETEYTIIGTEYTNRYATIYCPVCKHQNTAFIPHSIIR